MLSFKNARTNHRLFLLIYTIVAISIISVFRHGTTLLYLILWLYLFIGQKQPLQTLKTSSTFALTPPFIFLSLLMGLGVFSTFWSILPIETLRQSTLNLLTFGSFAIFFAVLIKQDLLSSKAMLTSFTVICGVSIVLILFQAINEQTIRYYLHYSNRGLKPNAEVLVILVLPLISAFLYQKKYGWAGLLYLASITLTSIVGIRTSFIALVVGGCIAAAYYVLPRVLIWGTSLVSFIYTLSLPWIMPLNDKVTAVYQNAALPESFIHRLYIWTFVSEKIKEKPWLGWGVNASHNFPGGNDLIGQSLHMTQLPSHPHNEVMQIWLEQGLVGAFLLACFHGSLFWQLRKESNRLVMSMYGFYLTSVFIMLQMSHSAWHKWWITWIALCGGFLMAISKNVSRETCD